MCKQSHSPDRAVVPSGSHPSAPFALDFQLSTVNFFLTSLQSALTQNAPVTPLQSADPKTRHLKSFRIRTSGYASPNANEFDVFTDSTKLRCVIGYQCISPVSMKMALDW